MMHTPPLGMPFLLENDSIEHAAALCATLGLDFVELNMTFPPCTPEHLHASNLRALAEQYGIFFTFHLHEDFAPCSFSAPVRHAWLQEASAALTLARDAGVPSINLHWPAGIQVTLPHKKEYLSSRYLTEYLQYTQDFRDLCLHHAQGQVRICIENTDGFRPFQQEAIDLLLQVPCFGLTLDTGHDHCAHNSDAAFYAAHADRLWHMHLHDAAGDLCHLPLGSGELNISALLKQAGQARVVLEIKTIAALRESLRFLSL